MKFKPYRTPLKQLSVLISLSSSFIFHSILETVSGVLGLKGGDKKFAIF